MFIHEKVFWDDSNICCLINSILIESQQGKKDFYILLRVGNISLYPYLVQVRPAPYQNKQKNSCRRQTFQFKFISLFVGVSVCMTKVLCFFFWFVCMYLYDYMCMCVNSYKSQKSVLGIFLYVFYFSFWEKVSYWTWRLSRQLCWILQSLSFQCWVYRHILQCSVFMWVPSNCWKYFLKQNFLNLVSKQEVNKIWWWEQNLMILRYIWKII